MTVQEIKQRLIKSIKLMDNRDSTINSIEDGFDYLDTCIQYILLDLESTCREKKNLESGL